MAKEAKLNSTDAAIVKALLDSKAVNFEALGKVVASVGPSAVLMDDDGWIRICGSDMRIYRWPRRFGLEELGVLRDIVAQLPGR
jgi:hypothetical protein